MEGFEPEKTGECLRHRGFNDQVITEWMRDPYRRILFDMEPAMAVGLIGQLQLAFRHPLNIGPTRQLLEKYVRDTIEKLDPDHGDVYNFLMAGFDPEQDEVPDHSWPEFVEKL